MLMWNKNYRFADEGDASPMKWYWMVLQLTLVLDGIAIGIGIAWHCNLQLAFRDPE